MFNSSLARHESSKLTLRELMWDHDDDIQFRIEDERIVIRNVTIENE